MRVFRLPSQEVLDIMRRIAHVEALLSVAAAHENRPLQRQLEDLTSRMNWLYPR